MEDLKKKGWVRFYRKSIDSSVWKNPIIWMVWSWCLLKANHQSSNFPFNGKDIEIEEGQFITGRNQALKELPITTQNWKTAITYLKSTSRLTIQPTNRFSIFTLIKWKEYQNDEPQLTSQLTSQLNNHQPATNQPLTTNKNDKNEENRIEDKPMTSLLVWAEERRGGKFPSPKQQFTAMAIMKKAGIEIGKIKDRWEEMENDKFWQEKGFDFMNVAKSFDKRR